MATKAKVTPISAAPSAGKTKASSTEVALKKGSNVVSIQEALRAQAAAMSEKTAPASGNAIRVSQDKQFLLPDGTKTPGPLELVIVEFTSKNAFFEGVYDPKNITPAACFAIGSNPLKMVPSANAPLPQAVDCQACPNNQFGSDGDGKACKNTRVLAVLPPDADEDTPLWILVTSPTANKGFDAFVTGVARMFQTPPVGVVATVGFDPSVTYAKLVFSDPQPNPEVGVHFARQDEARAMLAVEPDVSKFVKAPPPRGKAAARR
jgi:hypothetical protein